MQAQAFIACLEQRGVGTSAPVQLQQVIVPKDVSMETPAGKPVLLPADAAATPIFRAPIAAPVTKPGITAAAAQNLGKENVEGPAAPGIEGAPVAAASAEADTFAGFLTPVKDRRNPLFDLPETPDSILKAESAPGALGGYAHFASFPVEPVSPILAAAAQALTAAAGQQQKQQIQLSAASHELQTVQQEQLGLREEISKAKSALADIAGQLRASIGGSAVSAKSSAAANNSSSSSSRSSTGSTGISKKPVNSNLAAHSKPPAVVSAGARAALAACRQPVGLSAGVPMSRTSSDKPSMNETLHKQPGSLATSSRQAKQQRSLQPGAASVSAAEEFTFPKLSSSKAAAPASSQNSGSSSTGSSQRPQQQKKKQWSNPLAQLQVQQQVAASSSQAMAPSGGTSATCSAATGSAKGSLSLDDLIKEAESVSLEYGMSPNCAGNLDDTATTSGAAAAVAAAASPAAVSAQLIFDTSGAKAAHSAVVKMQSKTAAEAAARSVALALIENQLTQESGCAAVTSAAAQGAEQVDETSPAAHHQQQQLHNQTPQSVAGSTKGPVEPVSMLDQQQEQQTLMQQRLEQCLADTPGSACSSAAHPGGAAAAAMQWLQQQASPLPMASLVETPPAVQLAGSKAADMQSAVRAAPAGPAVASAAAHKAAKHYSPMSQAGTPAGMEGCASNFLGHQSPEVSSTKHTALSKQQQSLVTPSFATPTAVAHHRAALAGLFADDEAAADDATSGAHKEHGCNESAANVPLHWQQPVDTPTAAAAAGASGAAYLTPAAAAIPVHQGLAPARQQASTIATKPPDISAPPGAAAAAAWSTPVGPAAKALQSAAAALLASISPAGTISPQDVVPDQILQQLTPEWLKELRQRCQHGTIQVQELRTQLGLATPQTVGHAATAHTAAAMTPAVTGAADIAGHSDGQSQLDIAPPQCSDRQRSAAAVTAKPAGAAAFGHTAMSDQALDSSLSQASSHSNMDKLRRRAMVQAAAAAAATPTADSGRSPAPGTDTEAAGLLAANSHDDLDRSDSTGSLVQYMQLQQSGLPSHCRTGSMQQEEFGVSPVPYRPGCPTPGSAYSAAATPAIAGSPDIMLADLSNSRMIAKQLQEQLQRHLGNTASMPNIWSGYGVDHAAGVCDAPQLRHTASEHDAFVEPAVADAAGSQLADVVEAADATPSQPTRTSSRFAGSAAADSNSPGMLVEASPLTPGAALNANAESKMLSPGVQLDQLFEASVSQLQQPEQGWESCSKSVSSHHMRRQLGVGAIKNVPVSCRMTPPDSCCPGSSTTTTLPSAAAVGATQQPDNDAAVPAHPTPAHSSISMPETSAHHSVRAHPLNSLAGVTQVTYSTHDMQAHAPCLSDAAHGLPAPRSAEARPAIAISIAEVTPTSMQHATANSGSSVAAHQLSNIAETTLTSTSHSMLAHTPCTSKAAHRPDAAPVLAPPISAAAATAPCASVPSSTASSACSIAAHKLLSLSASTHGMSGSHSMPVHTPCLSGAGQASAMVSTAAESGYTAAPCSNVHNAPCGVDLPHGRWSGSDAHAASVYPAAAVQSYPVSGALGASVDTADSCGPTTSTEVTQRSQYQCYAPIAAPSASQVAAAGDYVRLGVSPSSRSSSGTPEVGPNAVVAAESSEAFSLGTASSCCTSLTPAVTLGASPDAVTSATSSAPATNNTAASTIIAAATAAASHSLNAPRVPDQSNAHHTQALHSHPVSSIDSQTQQHVDSNAKPAESQVTALQPAGSSCTDTSSCRYATPAIDFGTPGVSSPEVYFTGLQHRSRSVSGRPTSDQDAGIPAAFSGFRTYPVEAAEAEEPVASPALVQAAVGQSLLQQLLASPSSSCASVVGSPAWIAAATAGPLGETASDLQQQQQQMLLDKPAVEITCTAEGLGSDMLQVSNKTEMLLASADQSVAASSPSAAVQGGKTCSRGSQTPVTSTAGPAAVDQQLVSHALSDRTSEVAAFSGVGEQEMQQETQHEGSQGSSDDFTGMTFQQRLEVLCAEDSSETDSPSSAARAEVLKDAGAVSQEEPHAMLQTPVLPGHVVCVATQTSPLLLDAATQVSCHDRQKQALLHLSLGQHVAG